MVALVFGVRERARGSDAGASRAKRRGRRWIRRRVRRSAYLVAVVLFALGNSSDAFLLLRAQQCGVAAKLVPMLWMVHNGAKAALSTWGGSLSDRIGRRCVIIAGWMLYALVYLAVRLRARAVANLGAVRRLRRLLRVRRGHASARSSPIWRRAGARGTRVRLVQRGHRRWRRCRRRSAFGALADRYGARLPFTVSAGLAAAASVWLALVVRRRPAPDSAAGS